MNTEDPTLNVNLLLEHMKICVDLTKKNAQHYNDREITVNLTDTQRLYLDLMKGEMCPAENMIREIRDVKDDD